MANTKTIDFSRFTRSETPDIAREIQPQLRPQAERERNPSTFERRQEQEGKSNWTGGVWAGRVDRSR
jgi:hypothetical protein